MATVIIGKGASNISTHNLSPFITSLTFDTEVDKGYSSCSITLKSSSIMSIPILAFDGTYQIKIYEDGGDLGWTGRIASISKTGTEITIEGVGLYELLNDYYYDDGSETYPLLDSNVVGTPVAFTMLPSTSNRRGIMVTATNNFGIDLPVSSFSCNMQRVGTPEGGFQGFILDSSKNVLFVTDTMDARTVSETAETFNFAVTSDVVIANGQDYYIGWSIDQTYWDAVLLDETSYLQGFGEIEVTTDHRLWEYNDSYPGWVSTPYTMDVSVIGKGRWDFDPGADQKEIITAITDHYLETFGENIPLRIVFANPSGTYKTIPYMKFSPDATAYEAIKTLLDLGNNTPDEYKMFHFYVYSDMQHSEPVFYIDTVDFSRQPVALIKVSSDRTSEDFSFQEMYSQVKVAYKDEFGFRAETTAYYTGNPHVTPREKLVNVSSEILDAEADIIAQLHQELESNPKGSRNLDLKPSDVHTVANSGLFPLHRIRAGMIIAVLSTDKVFKRDGHGYGYATKYFVRATSYDAMAKTLTIDISRQSDRERLLEILS